MSAVEIYQQDSMNKWKKIVLSRIIHKTDTIVIGGKWKILVDGEVVYCHTTAKDRWKNDE